MLSHVYDVVIPQTSKMTYVMRRSQLSRHDLLISSKVVVDKANINHCLCFPVWSLCGSKQVPFWSMVFNMHLLGVFVFQIFFFPDTQLCISGMPQACPRTNRFLLVFLPLSEALPHCHVLWSLASDQCKRGVTPQAITIHRSQLHQKHQSET